MQESFGGFVGALTILFIAYKLAGLISWSWLWVLSPLWITLSVCVIIALVAVVLDEIDFHHRERLREVTDD